MVAMRFLVVLTTFVVCAAADDDPDQAVGFTKEEKQSMIDLHNYYRARVARGEEPNQPKAADMIAMEWDDRLVRSSQKWSSTCKGWHNTNEERRFEPYPFTGQNYAGNYGYLESLRGWYDEVTEGQFVYEGLGCSSICGHYTQVVWSSAHLVGCAQDKCEAHGEGKKNVYCDYAPGANTVYVDKKDPVYLKGEPCSKCPPGFGFCMDGALCASKRACDNSDSKCECKISSCENGGTFDATNCGCKCKPDFEGLRCETACKDIIDLCDGMRKECSWDANGWMWMAHDCRKTCKKCGVLADPGEVNSDGIKTNVNEKMSNGKDKETGGKQTSEAGSSKPKQRNRSQSNPRKTNRQKSPPKKQKNPPKKKGACHNSYSGDVACNNWAQGGQCEAAAFMKEQCAKACGCKGGNPDCKNTYDANSDCDAFAKRGDCKTNPGWMNSNCALSCNCP